MHWIAAPEKDTATPRRFHTALPPEAINTAIDNLTRALTQNEAVAKASSALHLLGRIEETAEVALAICWLLDGAQGWVTGQVIGVDGVPGSVQARA